MAKIQSTFGNILKDSSQAIINTVNCVGVMGKGLALQFKQQYPEMFNSYKVDCQQGRLRLGTVTSFLDESGKHIVFFPTKGHWRDLSKISSIESGLAALKEWIIQNKIQSIAIPPLGCGLGGLDWGEVKPMIINALSDIDELQINLYEPVKPKPQNRFF